MFNRLFSSIFVFVMITFSASAEKVTRYGGSRIFWDMSSRNTVFANGGYARIIQLQDGRLMAVCESGGINIAFSNNMGKMWSSPTKIVNNINNTPNCVPDLIQLKDGTIIVAYNPRPAEPFTIDRKFGIRCKRSTDNGQTWSEEIFVNDAQHTFNDGCWEPSMLELPSGELQLYFADEGPYTMSNEQQISVCRSFDGGISWGKAEKISFRAGYRDGMPAPVLLKDNETIVVALEDNGWPGYNDFFPTTVRCDLATNWKNYFVDANSPNRHKTLDLNYCALAKGGAPYLRVLPWGETVLSWQSAYGHGSTNTMYTAVGDENALNFKAMSTPFVTSTSETALWNSVAVVDTGYVVAVAGINGKIEMINGYPTRLLQAEYGKPDIDGKLTRNEGYLRSAANQIMMGNVIGGSVNSDFAYDEDYLYFIVRVADRTDVRKGSTIDGVRLLIDADNVSSTGIEKGMYCFFLRRDNTCQAWHGETNSWKSDDAERINIKVTSTNNSYIAEAAIPWSMLGKTTAPTKQEMGATIEIVDCRSNTTITETVPDARRNASSTYMSFRLKDKEVTDGIENVGNEDSRISVKADNGKVVVSSTAGIKSIAFYSIDGQTLKTRQNPGKSSTTVLNYNGVTILKITLCNGKVISRKLVV